MSKVLRSVLIVGIAITFLHQTFSFDTPVKENFREASDYMMEHAGPQDVIVVSAPFTIYPMEYYYRGPALMETLPLWDRYSTAGIPGFSEERLPKDIETIKGTHQTAWLLMSYDQGYEEKIRLYFDTHFERLEMKQFSPGLTLYSYKLRYDIPAQAFLWSQITQR